MFVKDASQRGTLSSPSAHNTSVVDAGAAAIAAPRDETDRIVRDLWSPLGDIEPISLGDHPGGPGMRQRILDAAIEIFAARGFGSTTMKDLASAVGIKAPGLYAHFASKEEILSLAMLRALRGFVAFMTTPFEQSTPTLILEETVRRHVRYQLDHLDTTRANDLLLASDALGEFLPGPDFERLRKVQRAYHQMVKARIADALPTGSPIDPGITAFAVINLCDLVTSWYQPNGGLTVDDVADLYWFYVMGMLRIA